MPKDPAQENVDALDGTELKAFEGQDHDAHIAAHLTFMASGIVQSLPNVAISLQKHIMEHIKLFAQEQAAAQFLQQSGGREATEEDMLQVEALIATIVADKVASVRMMSQQIMAGAQQEGPDPLLALKERELAIDEQKTLADIQNDQAKLQLEQEKLAERARQFSQRIQSCLL